MIWAFLAGLVAGAVLGIASLGWFALNVLADLNPFQR